MLAKAIRNNKIKISDSIKRKTHWNEDYKSVEDIHHFVKNTYFPHSEKIDFSSELCSCLRTLSPGDYFKIVQYQNNIPIAKEKNNHLKISQNETISFQHIMFGVAQKILETFSFFCFGNKKVKHTFDFESQKFITV